MIHRLRRPLALVIGITLLLSIGFYVGVVTQTLQSMGWWQ